MLSTFVRRDRYRLTSCFAILLKDLNHALSRKLRIRQYVFGPKFANHALNFVGVEVAPIGGAQSKESVDIDAWAALQRQQASVERCQFHWQGLERRRARWPLT
jgi:hypothetical protein